MELVTGPCTATILGTCNKRSSLSMSLDAEGTSEEVSKPKLMLQAATPDASLASSGLPSSVSSVGSQRRSESLMHLQEGGSTGSSDSEMNSSEESEGQDVFSSAPSGSPRVRSSEDGASDPELGELVSGEQRTARILTAVEFYFSDEHVAKDAFMYRHIMRGKGGFVNMKLVASFRKVKNITKDWMIVRDAVRSSTILQLNEEGTKVKRLVAFSPTINPLAKCVMVYNLGSKPSMGVVEQHLEQYGRICKISIYFPGQAVPNEVRTQRSRLEIAATEPLAVVEFSTAEEARRIILQIQQAAPSSTPSIKVALLNLKGGSIGSHRMDSCSGSENEPPMAPIASTRRDQANDEEHLLGHATSGDGVPDKSSQGSPGRRRKKKTRLQHLARDDNSGTSDTGSECGSSSSNSKIHHSRSNEGANSPSWRSNSCSPFSSPKPKSVPHLESQSSSSSAGKPTNAAAIRRLWSHNNTSSSSTASQKSLSCDGILRQPHGPSENGFTMQQRRL
ncbi:la-related protein 6-like [Sycon ciliatum]|uniref:la-related protein 6-like n=1 Tax=Sycon ciliatum TaxID=27933 RepID=UPI0020A9A985|eukprot:scpid46161/ scgid8585/ La-related protein 6; Acheron; La ribonucleoprotein domain family member 6